MGRSRRYDPVRCASSAPTPERCRLQLSPLGTAGRVVRSGRGLLLGEVAGARQRGRASKEFVASDVSDRQMVPWTVLPDQCPKLRRREDGRAGLNIIDDHSRLLVASPWFWRRRPGRGCAGRGSAPPPRTSWANIAARWCAQGPWPCRGAQWRSHFGRRGPPSLDAPPRGSPQLVYPASAIKDDPLNRTRNASNDSEVVLEVGCGPQARRSQAKGVVSEAFRNAFSERRRNTTSPVATTGVL